MPHLMNCDHSEDGWCLECVRKLWEEKNQPRPHSPDAYALVEKVLRNREVLKLAMRIIDLEELKLDFPDNEREVDEELIPKRARLQQLIDSL